jgi:hypothetical protein
MVMPADVLLCEILAARCTFNALPEGEPEPASARSRNSRVHASRGLAGPWIRAGSESRILGCGSRLRVARRRVRLSCKAAGAMRVSHEHALFEVQLQLELDHQRGVPPLTPRARALQQARASGDQQAQRQALIDLAAACVAMAAKLPAPVHALNELERRTTIPRLPRPTKRAGSSKPGGTVRGNDGGSLPRRAAVRPRPSLS